MNVYKKALKLCRKLLRNHNASVKAETNYNEKHTLEAYKKALKASMKVAETRKAYRKVVAAMPPASHPGEF